MICPAGSGVFDTIGFSAGVVAPDVPLTWADYFSQEPSNRVWGLLTDRVTAHHAFTFRRLFGDSGNMEDGDVIRLALDMDQGKIWLGKNDEWPDGDPATGLNPTFSGLPNELYAAVMMDSRQCGTSQSTLTALTDFGPTFNYSVPDGFNAGGNIYGHMPVPQTNGFDYYFTPLKLDTSVLGEGVTVESIEVSAAGTNNGEVVNFDWEVHIGPASFGLPEGQFTKTLTDPVSGYTRTAPTQFRVAIGNQVDNQNYNFSASHDFATGTTTANPYYSVVHDAFTAPMDLADGLYAQVFLWTADNRNSQIDFGDITLTVRGKMPFVQVEIDVMPGKTPNSIDPSSRRKISVAILGTEDFDALDVNFETVEFGLDGATESHGRAHVKDVDGDGYMDLLLHFDTQDTGIACGDTEATLTGETFGGEPISGSDSIVTVKCD
jgi:hypothetical protein